VPPPAVAATATAKCAHPRYCILGIFPDFSLLLSNQPLHLPRRLHPRLPASASTRGHPPPLPPPATVVCRRPTRAVHKDGEAKSLAKDDERWGIDCERDSDRRKMARQSDPVPTAFFLFLPVKNVLERLLELL
jgi:hypothetical protein